MKLRNIEYNDHEEPKEITVTMSMAEAIALVNIAGKLNGHAEKKLGLSGGDDSLYICLADVMNMHYEYGAPDLHIDLGTINNE